MEENIFSTIIERVNMNILDKQNISVNVSDFKKIVKKELSNKIAFIDGGNAELLKAVNFSLQFVRTGFVIFKDNKKIKSKINEFFVLVYSDMENDSLVYKTEIFPVKGKAIENISFNSFDKTIMDGVERGDISKIAGVVRRFAEISMAEEVIDELDKGDIVVLDGSLKCIVTNEEAALDKLYSKGLENDVIVSGLAKTSNIFIEDSCLLSELSKLNIDFEGFYKILDEKGYNVYAVKLNKNSKYIFEFDITDENSVSDVLSLLSANSNDAVFPGYPYGLIFVDRIARISNEEKGYLLTKLQVKAGKDWSRIKDFLNRLNAHEILDNI